MAGGIFPFDGTDHSKIKKTQIEELKGLTNEQELPKLVVSLIDLIHGNQKKYLDNRGYVIAVNGLWGSGKTTATWAVINEINKRLEANGCKEKFEVIDKEFLLFGNSSESISSFLREFAYKLWTVGYIDVRDDIEQFILEVTPANDSGYMLSAGAGPFSISRPIKLKPKNITHEVIKTKFLKLAGSHKVVIVVLDDLDRLKPEEIVQIMRMVEKLRKIPRLIIILPVYQAIITKAFETQLNLTAIAAPTFVRKLVDYSVNLTNGLNDLRTVFDSHFQESDVKAFHKALGGRSVRDLCWYMLLHVLITHEAAEFIALVEDRDERNRVAQQEAFSTKASPYLAKLRYLFDRHQNIRKAEAEIKALPTHAIVEGKEQFLPFGHNYGNLQSSRPADEVLVQLREISNKNNAMMQICTDPDIESRVKGGEPVEFSTEVMQNNHTTAVEGLFIQYLQESTDEPYLTTSGKYQLREIDNLSRIIVSNIYADEAGDVIENLYEAVRRSFVEFQDQRK